MPETAEGSGAEQGLLMPSRGAGGPKVPVWADIRNGSCNRAKEVGRFLLSSQHQPGFPHTSWYSSRAASLAGFCQCIPGHLWFILLKSMLFLNLPPRAAGAEPDPPSEVSAQPWLPLPMAVGSARSCSSAVPVVGTSSLTCPVPPSEGQAGKGSQVTASLQLPTSPAPRDARHSQQGPQGAASVSLPGVC